MKIDPYGWGHMGMGRENKELWVLAISKPKGCECLKQGWANRSQRIFLPQGFEVLHSCFIQSTHFALIRKKKGGKCSLSIMNFFKCLSPRGYFPSPPGQRATSAPDSQGSGKAWFSNTSPTQLSQLLPQAQDMTCWVQWSLWRTSGQEVEEYSDQILLRWPQRGNLPYYSPISSAGKIARFYDLSSVSIITAT